MLLLKLLFVLVFAFGIEASCVKKKYWHECTNVTLSSGLDIKRPGTVNKLFIFDSELNVVDTDLFGESYGNLAFLNMTGIEIKVIDFDALEMLTSLTTLILAHNQLQDLNFSIPVLEHFDVSYNRLKTLDNMQVQLPEVLTRFDAQHNDVEEIRLEFKNFTKLLHLDLSYNKIRDMPPSAFDALESLEHLNLESNMLTALDDAHFMNLIKLEYLNLKSNKLIAITEKTFKNLSGLKYLYMDNNQITTIHENAFLNNIALEKLSMVNNLISELKPKMLLNKPELKYLSLEGNLIEKLDQKTFDAVHSLIYLNLAGNSLSAIDDGIFASLQNLEYLHLDNNKITHVSEKSLSSMTNLLYIDLSHNSIDTDIDFKGCERLVTIKLNHNDFSTIALKIYNDFADIDMSNNRIDSVSEVRVIFPEGITDMGLSILDLSDNRIEEFDPFAFTQKNKHLQKVKLSGNKLTQNCRTSLERYKNIFVKDQYETVDTVTLGSQTTKGTIVTTESNLVTVTENLIIKSTAVIEDENSGEFDESLNNTDFTVERTNETITTGSEATCPVAYTMHDMMMYCASTAAVTALLVGGVSIFYCCLTRKNQKALRNNNYRAAPGADRVYHRVSAPREDMAAVPMSPAFMEMDNVSYFSPTSTIRSHSSFRQDRPIVKQHS